jgi:hypothetical protein
MSFFGKDVINVWQIKSLTNSHIHMDDDKQN